MGLDMYMYRETYVKNWEHMKEEEIHEITVKRGGEVRTDINPERISTISENIAYWRKFNALHNWIVQNCAGGRDECQKIYISHDQLGELYDILKQVHNNHSLAEELLPTESGFFFGSTEYDEYYFDQVKDTIEIFRPYINNILDGKENSDFYYEASW